MNRDRKSWTLEVQSRSTQEDNAIKDLVEQYGSKNWAFISHRMKDLHQMVDRSGKQCRERWINHLNPEINKDKWCEEEEALVFQNYLKYGNRWKEISLQFPGRTDNCIKNHFYSTLRRSLRRINKFVGIRNSTEKMREIKPSILSKMLDNSVNTNNFNDVFKDFAKILFEFSSFKPTKDNIGLMQDLFNTKYRKSIVDVLNAISQLNDTYAKNKEELTLSRVNPNRVPAPKRQKAIQTVSKQQSEQPSKSSLDNQQDLISFLDTNNDNQIETQNEKGDVGHSKSLQEDNSEEVIFSRHQNNGGSRRQSGYSLDEKSEKFDFEMEQPDSESYYFNDLQIVGQSLKLFDAEPKELPVQDREIFQMIYKG